MPFKLGAVWRHKHLRIEARITRILYSRPGVSMKRGARPLNASQVFSTHSQPRPRMSECGTSS